MARVTVEDCIVKVPNRFELVLLAGQRARDITAGAPLTVEKDDDKNPVVALREIADETVTLDQLRESLVRGMQKHVEIDEPEETSELDLAQTLFAAGEPIGAVIEENATDEEAVEEELAEDMLSVEGEEAVEGEGLGTDDLESDVLRPGPLGPGALDGGDLAEIEGEPEGLDPEGLDPEGLDPEAGEASDAEP